jgi:hypothetical protein
VARRDRQGALPLLLPDEITRVSKKTNPFSKRFKTIKEEVMRYGTVFVVSLALAAATGGCTAQLDDPATEADNSISAVVQWKPGNRNLKYAITRQHKNGTSSHTLQLDVHGNRVDVRGTDVLPATLPFHPDQLVTVSPPGDPHPTTGLQGDLTLLRLPAPGALVVPPSSTTEINFQSRFRTISITPLAARQVRFHQELDYRIQKNDPLLKLLEAQNPVTARMIFDQIPDWLLYGTVDGVYDKQDGSLLSADYRVVYLPSKILTAAQLLSDTDLIHIHIERQ